MTPATGRVHAVLVTFRRPDWLRRSLEALTRQTRPPETVTVVDNAPDGDGHRLTEVLGERFDSIAYLPSAANLGPAGGLAVGAEHVLAQADAHDWLLFLDDDDPPREAGAVSRLVDLAESLREQGTPLGGVGQSGARLDRRTGRVVRPADDELHGAVPVDHIGGNQLPLYAVAALREVGPHDARLFFGFEELELGLRLERSGYRLFSHGAMQRARREAIGRLGPAVRPSSRYSGPPDWRRYYSLRNQIWILRDHGLHRQAVSVALQQGLAKPGRNLVGQPRWALHHAGLNARAVRDGFAGRLGLTVPPG